MGGLAKKKADKKNQLNPFNKVEAKKNQKWAGKTSKSTQGKQVLTYGLVAGIIIAGGFVAFRAYRHA